MFFENIDCMQGMKSMADNSVDLTLTDIPYNACNEEVCGKQNGLRSYDKGVADALTFDILDFLSEVYRVTKSTIIIFCGWEQLGDFYKWLRDKDGTARTLVWEKVNPSVMNGKVVYLSGIEGALWFKKRGGTFNAMCKNTVFRYPLGSSEMHPTKKNHALLAELIADNSNEGDLVFDPCAGSGSTLLVARKGLRRIKGFELHKPFYDKALARLNQNASMF